MRLVLSHNLQAVMAYITTGVQPTMGSPPPPKPPLPRIPTREEFLASVTSGIPVSPLQDDSITSSSFVAHREIYNFYLLL
jgi:hypothetical protein